MGRKDLHVVPHSRGWAVRDQRDGDPRFVFDTRGEALAKAEELAAEEQSAAVLHDQDGAVQDKERFGGNEEGRPSGDN